MPGLTTKQLRDWLEWRQLQRTPVTDLPLANRIRGKLHAWGDVRALLWADMAEVCRGMAPDEEEAVREVLHVIRNHPGSAVRPLGTRAS